MIIYFEKLSFNLRCYWHTMYGPWFYSVDLCYFKRTLICKNGLSILVWSSGIDKGSRNAFTKITWNDFHTSFEQCSLLLSSLLGMFVHGAAVLDRERLHGLAQLSPTLWLKHSLLSIYKRIRHK